MVEYLETPACIILPLFIEFMYCFMSSGVTIWSDRQPKRLLPTDTGVLGARPRFAEAAAAAAFRKERMDGMDGAHVVLQRVNALNKAFRDEVWTLNLFRPQTSTLKQLRRYLK